MGCWNFGVSHRRGIFRVIYLTRDGGGGGGGWGSFAKGAGAAFLYAAR